MVFNDELLDLVNEQDQVIGQLWRSEVYAKKLSNFRAINAFLQNDQGQLWIPRRCAHKKLFPLALDASAAGHVGAGETYDQAFARELMEELRMDLSTTSFKHIGTLDPHQHSMSAFVKIYLIHTNEIPNYNPDDYIEYYWLSPQQVLDRIAAGDPSKSDLPKMLKHLFF